MEDALSRFSDLSECPDDDGMCSFELPGVVGRDGERYAGDGAVNTASCGFGASECERSSLRAWSWLSSSCLWRPSSFSEPSVDALVGTFGRSGSRLGEIGGADSGPSFGDILRGGARAPPGE